MSSDKVEFIFLKTSVEKFIQDLRTIEDKIKAKAFSENEELELMSYLVSAREIIELIESNYLVF